MDHAYIEENQVIDRYLMRRLPEEENALFEDHSMSCSDCLDRLKMAERMHRGLKLAFEERAAGDPAAGDPADMDPSQTVGRKPSYWRHGLIAASLLMASAALYLVIEAPNLGRQAGGGATGDAILNLPFVALSPVRGDALQSEPSFIVRVGERVDWFALALLLDGQERGPFRVAVSDQSGREVWSGEGLVPDAMGEVRLALSSGLFAPGVFSLAVYENRQDGDPFTVARYSFRLAREP